MIWRCYVGVDEPNELVRETWPFLQPHVRDAHVAVFSREAFVWDGLDPDRVAIITPTIDAFTPKNEELSPETVLSVLRASALVADGTPATPVTFRRQDGTPGRVERRVEMIEEEPAGGDSIVVQVSAGTRSRIRSASSAASPSTWSRKPTPTSCTRAHRSTPSQTIPKAWACCATDRGPLRSAGRSRRRIHLATLPMGDLDENAVMVNALQRHARVVVQKSIAEGFGLTVAEAMWKGRPVVASRVGGIDEQIINGESGVLLDDPRDLRAFGRAIAELLA